MNNVRQPKDYEDDEELRQLEEQLRSQEAQDQNIFVAIVVAAFACLAAALVLTW